MRVVSVVMFGMVDLAIVVGCGHSNRSAAPPATQVTATSSGSACEPAKSHLYELLTSDKTIEDSGGAFPAMASSLFDACTRDRWSPEAIDCFATAPAVVELQPCLDRLSAVQRDSLETSWEDVMRTKPAPTKRRSPTEIAKMTVDKYAFEAFPVWAMEHPDQACPARLDELASVMPLDAKDPWGHPYAMACGTPGVLGLRVVSLGPDGKSDTDDDIKSWEKPGQR